MHEDSCVLFTSRSCGWKQRISPQSYSVANRVIVIVFKCVRRSELVAPNSNSSNKDISMQFRDIGDRCCNFAERDEIFQFLKLSSKACQPSELRYFRLKNLKVAFKIKQLYRILEPEKSRRLTVLIIFAFSIVWACGLKSFFRRYRIFTTSYMVGKKLHYF